MFRCHEKFQNYFVWEEAWFENDDAEQVTSVRWKVISLCLEAWATTISLEIFHLSGLSGAGCAGQSWVLWQCYQSNSSCFLIFIFEITKYILILYSCAGSSLECDSASLACMSVASACLTSRLSDWHAGQHTTLWADRARMLYQWTSLNEVQV